MRTVEERFERYADELAEAMSNDLNRTCVILTKIFKGETVGDATTFIEELKDNTVLNDCFGLADNLILKGTRPGSDHAYGRICDIMETLHYDNGLPLSGYNYPKDNPTEWHDYFEHYDRDQDLWGFWWDEEIYNFVTDGKSVYMRVDWSLADLRASLVAAYDGASWEHDFDREW